MSDWNKAPIKGDFVEIDSNGNIVRTAIAYQDTPLPENIKPKPSKGLANPLWDCNQNQWVAGS